MFSRNIQNTVLSSKDNLKTFSAGMKTHFANGKFRNFIMLIPILEDMANVRVKMRSILQDFGPIQMLRNKYLKVPPAVKEQSGRCLRIWAYQCECVLAQRLRRFQQMFCLYSRLWEEHALQDLLKRMRHQFTHHGKKLMYGAVGITAFSWEANQITNIEIEKHMDEFDYIQTLINSTMICPKNKCIGTISNGSKSLIPSCKCPERVSTKRTHDDWITFTESQDIIVWRRSHSSGNYEYKVYGSYSDVTGEDFLNVQIDCAYRKKWDDTAIALEVVESDPRPQSNSDIVYWEMLWPTLFSNRDYVFNRRYLVDSNKKTIIIVSRCIEHPACPHRRDKYRVSDYWSYMVIRAHSELNKPGVEFGLTYFDNPGTNIPSTISTWVAMRAMPDFMSRLREAAKNYKNYCRLTNRTCICDVWKQQKVQDELVEDSSKGNGQDEKSNQSGDAQGINLKLQQSPDAGKGPSEGTRSSVESGNSNMHPRITDFGTDITNSSITSSHGESEKMGYMKYLHPYYYFS